MDKVIFKVYKNDPIKGQFIRTNPKILELINQIQRETGVSATKITEKALELLSENYEVEEL